MKQQEEQEEQEEQEMCQNKKCVRTKNNSKQRAHNISHTPFENVRSQSSGCPLSIPRTDNHPTNL